MTTCVFDEILAGARPAHLVLDEEDVFAFLDARPVFPGHTLVVPKAHVESIQDLPSQLLTPLLDAGRRIGAAQHRALDAQGTFYGLNDVVSQSVPHVHLHVVPRSKGDGLRGFFWPRTRYADDDHAAGVAAQLRAAL